jgi:hypothetical protein
MNKQEAHEILDNYKSSSLINIRQALIATGDLNVQEDPTRPSRALRKDGAESCYVRSREIEGAGTGERFNWTMDWHRKRNRSED